MLRKREKVSNGLCQRSAWAAIFNYLKSIHSKRRGSFYNSQLGLSPINIAVKNIFWRLLAQAPGCYSKVE
jgi:hypothetical protein